MAQPERFDALILGSGTGGKLVAWHMASSGRRTAAVEQRWPTLAQPGWSFPTGTSRATES